ncbi:MAG: hypothetical protein QXX18_03130 [Candidatus Jordarchaeales archaeon]|nr:hypothetical protein [Candidatus Jordarchaeia archaeon]
MSCMTASQQTPPQNEESGFKNQKIVELLAPVREQVIRCILARFPMRGLEQILRETFDSAVIENMMLFSSLINSATQEGGGELNEHQLREKREEKQLKAAMLEAKELLRNPSSESEEREESLKEDLSRLKKEIDRLILELKIKDRKLRRQEKLLEKLRAIAENGLVIPVLENNLPSNPEIISFWKRVSDFLEKDPKFKILRLLLSVKEATVNGIYQSVGTQREMVAKCLEEMKNANLIKVTGESISLNL